MQRAVLATVLAADVIAAIPVRADSGYVRRWHRYPETFGDILETTAVFKALGIEPTYFDITEIRAAEIIIDLNEPIPGTLCGQFSLAIDTGTLEHCFNVGVAFKSMCSMVKKDGVVITAAPMTMMNHGFWSFSPTTYHDFFTQNGFKI